VTSDSGDRRSARRVLFPCEAHAFGVGERLPQAHLADLSIEGAFVATPSEIPSGEIVILKFRADECDLKLEAEVVHVEPGRGLGVRFLRLTSVQRTAIEHAIEAAEERR
jgi:hypothetical protein